MNQDQVNYTLYPLIINQGNLVADTYNNKYRYSFPAGSVKFKNAKCAIASIAIYYSWFNISAQYGNNQFSYIWTDGSGSSTIDVTIPDGYYSVSDLNTYLQQVMITNGHYLVDNNGNYVYYLELIENATYYGVQLNCFAFPTALPGGWSNPAALLFPALASTPQFIVNNSGFGSIIGFALGTYPTVVQTSNQSFLSTATPAINPVNSVILTCNLLNNKYANPNTILYSFTTEGAQFGGLISSSPNEFYFVDIQEGSYNEIFLSFIDQNFNPLQIRDTQLVITLLIKSE